MLNRKLHLKFIRDRTLNSIPYEHIDQACGLKFSPNIFTNDNVLILKKTLNKLETVRFFVALNPTQLNLGPV